MAGGSSKFIVEPTSPYFLHPSEGPGVMITAVVFNGKNYDLWEKAVTTALLAKNKLGFIDGTLQKPTPKDDDGKAELQAWTMVNSMVSSWLINVIDSKLRTSVAYVETAEGMWQNLKRRYAVASAPRIHQLKSDVASCKQGGLSIVEFFSKLMGLWSELDNYARFPQCRCGKCECEINDKLMKMSEEEKTHQFLMGLDDDFYATIRSQILALEPLPSIDKVFNIVQQEENHRHLMRGRDDRDGTMAAFAVKVHRDPVEKSTCKHCGRYGHDESNCFEVIGYPPGWGSRGRGRGRGRGGHGGRVSTGRGRGAGFETVNAVVSAKTPDVAASSEDSTAIAGLSAEQVQRLLSLIETPKSGYDKLSGNCRWIFDTGASSHMTGNYKLLKAVTHIDPIPVGLPDGRIAIARKCGTVELSPRITL